MKTFLSAPYMVMCLVMTTSSLAFAEDVIWHGFVAQGVIQSKDSNFINEDGDVSFELTEVGLNASYRFNSKLRLAGQGVYLSAGHRYEEGTRLDYLFFDWQAISTLDWQVNVHLGRYKNYHWLYSATRDVPHTRPSIVLPQSVYFDVFRDVALGSDGIALIGSTTNEFGDWEVNLSYGSSHVSRGQTENLLSTLSTGNLKQDYVQQLSLFWQPVDTKLRLSLSLLDSDFSYEQGQQDVYIDGEATSQRFMLAGIYSSQNWELAFELLRERAIYSDFLFPGFSSDQTSEAGYVQGRYFLTSDVAIMLRLDLFDLDRKDRNGTGLALRSGGTTPTYFGFQDQATIGLSWEFAPNWQVQAEFHRTKGTARLAPVLVPNTVINDSKYWNVWAVQFMHWF